MLSKVFKAYDVRGVYPKPLNEKVAKKIGLATGRFLRSKLTRGDEADPMLQHVVVGRDMRKSSPKMAAGLIEGLRAAEMNVFDVGMVDTSFIYFAINHLGCSGGVQTTASHNPAEYNGFKFSGRNAMPIGADTGLVEIQRVASTIDATTVKAIGRLEERDLWDDYIDHVRKFLDLKRPLKVVVDASNGMAAAFVPRIFEGLPSIELIKINFEITGSFYHDPNPLVPENMAQTQAAVREHGADLGVCFDGDADRCMVTDELGNIIGCDILGALFAKHFLAQDPGAPIAYDLRSSKALLETIEAAGGKPLRGKVGHVNMKKLMRDNDAVFGAELSGHMYYRDNFYTDSGAITFAVVMSVLAATDGPLSGLIGALAPYKQSGEINFKVEDKAAAIKLVEGRYGGEGEIDHLDGATIDCWKNHGWWVNVRASNTEPMLRMNLEARDEAILQKMLSEITPLLGTPLVGH